MIEGVTIIRGEQPGKTVAIMGGVHGNEICGVRVLDQLKDALRIDNGTVYLIYGNPLAIKRGVRQIDMNLNRAFVSPEQLSNDKVKGYEYARAQELMPLLKSCNALLDIHSSATPNSVPFIICEPSSYEIVKYFPFEIISSGWDSCEPGGTDAFVNGQGGYGICIECGRHLDPKAQLIAKETAEIFLRVMGLVSGAKPAATIHQKIINVWHIHITQSDFNPARQFGDFEKLHSGELIGHDGERAILAPEGAYILFCRERKGPGEEAFLLGRLVKQ